MAVARERVAVSQGVAGQADDLSFLPFGGNNAQILAWLDVLLKGKPEQQAIARTEIAMLLEAKGFAEDAEEAYWTNVQARSTDRRSYDRLIELYQQRKDRLSESLVRLAISYITAPSESPETTATSVARLRGAFIDCVAVRSCSMIETVASGS